MAYLFQQLAKGQATSPMAKVGFMKNDSGVKPTTIDSKKWMRGKASAVKSVSTSGLINKAQKVIARPTPQDLGKMVMFFYDPKNKETLPFYDRFPLIFIVETYKDGFLGINLHYLPTMWRAKLMDALYSTINNKKFDDTTRLRLSYGILSNASKMRMFAPCLKRYLYSHVRSNMAVVDSSEWDYAAFLPLARFSKSSTENVYKDSLSRFSR